MSADPDITAAFKQAADDLAALIRPYVQAHLVDNLARQYVANHLAAPGWRPPLRPAPEDWRTVRATNTRRALEEP